MGGRLCTVTGMNQVSSDAVFLLQLQNRCHFVIAADIILKMRRFEDLVHNVLKLNTDWIKALNLNIS